MEDTFTKYQYEVKVDNTLFPIIVCYRGVTQTIEFPVLRFPSTEKLTKDECHKIMKGTRGIISITGDFKIDDSKYYTPEISEFYIGFECELTNYLMDFEWVKETCDIQTLNMANESWEREDHDFKKEFRIKYLDQSDIESLGYKKEKPEWHSWWNNFWKEYDWGVIKIRVKNEKRIALIITCLSKDNTSRIIFEGRVKNLSLLKQLLKMLKVE